jgi:hypothetical protein
MVVMSFNLESDAREIDINCRDSVMLEILHQAQLRSG